MISSLPRPKLEDSSALGIYVDTSINCGQIFLTLMHIIDTYQNNYLLTVKVLVIKVFNECFRY